MRATSNPTNPDWACWRTPAHQTRTHPVLGWPMCAECGAKPGYPDRFQALAEGLVLAVYVLAEPTGPTAALIAPGSGIVGLPDTNANTDRIEVHYEGWVNGAAQYADRDAYGRWEAGVEHAAGRLVVQYPTTAMTALPGTTLRQVGDYYPRARRVDVFDREALDAWIAAER